MFDSSAEALGFFSSTPKSVLTKILLTQEFFIYSLQVPMFMEADAHFIRELSLKTIPYIFSPGNLTCALESVIEEKKYLSNI